MHWSGGTANAGWPACMKPQAAFEYLNTMYRAPRPPGNQTTDPSKVTCRRPACQRRHETWQEAIWRGREPAASLVASKTEVDRPARSKRHKSATPCRCRNPGHSPDCGCKFTVDPCPNCSHPHSLAINIPDTPPVRRVLQGILDRIESSYYGPQGIEPSKELHGACQDIIRAFEKALSAR